MLEILCFACGFHRHKKHKKHIKPATRLRAQFTKHNEGTMTEKYTLAWIPGPCVTQDVVRVQNGAEVVLAADLANTESSVDVDFTTDDQVEWFVRSKDPNAKNGPSIDSAHAQFVASNQTPELVGAATGLNATWVSHTP